MCIYNHTYNSIYYIHTNEGRTFSEHSVATKIATFPARKGVISELFVEAERNGIGSRVVAEKMDVGEFQT